MNKDLTIIIVGKILQVIIMFASIRLLTTYLSPEEIGNYYIILAIISFFNLVLLNPPGMYFSRNLLHLQRSKDLFNAIFVFIIWIIIIAFVSVPISIGIYDWLEYDSRIDLYLFVIYIFLAILISTIHRNVLNGSNALGYRKEFVVYLIITLLIGLILSVSIVYLYYDFALGWLIGVVISEALMLYIIFKFFIQKNELDVNKIKLTLTKKRIKNILIFSLPIGLTTFLMWGQNTAYRFIVDYQYSAEVLGYIGVGLGVSAAVFSSIESISIQYFYPIFLKNILDATKDERVKVWNNIATQIVPIYILAVFFTITMSEVLINILVDKKFHDSYIYAMFGIGIQFFRVMTNLLTKVSQSEYKTTNTINPYLLGLILSLGLLLIIDVGNNYFLIPLILSTSYFFVFVYMYFNMKKLLDIRYNIKIFKIIFLSTPFFLIYFINLAKTNIGFNLLLIATFGLYFLYIVWFLNKQNLKGSI
jgi:O-antigen/teichoic acid export membrane protein